MNEAPQLDDADRQRFEQSFAEHADDVARLCRRLLGSSPAAAEAAQEVFLRAQRGFARYDPARPFRRWLLAVASHTCIDELRRRNRDRQRFAPESTDATELADPAPTPLRHALQVEARARLLTAIDSLPPRYRVPLVLRYFRDLEYEAIAKALGVTSSQVGTLLLRGRRRLRDALARGAT